jgi:predicted nucleic acid-binding Zn ribbon protein
MSERKTVEGETSSNRPRRRSVPRQDPGPASLQSLVVPTLARLGLRGRARQVQVMVAWPRVVGDHVAAETRPTFFARGRLTIETTSPALSHQLRLQAQMIIDALNQRIGEDLVKELHFKLGAS